ncbi:flagellar export chaperone FliS [Anaerosolibacter sp.]|uniref:flagellar export chaperone FliS n=1 Tax=Anaerosolibacter sp. TaxID=1872527 RepID=UPI0039EEAF79
MALNNPYTAYSQYKQNNIMLASPQELTLMLYNGAIKFANQAILAIDEKNIPKAHEAIVRASDIIIHLNSTLDMKYEVSNGLSQLYDFITHQLQEANIKKDKQILVELLPILTELRDTWKEAMNLAKKA